MARKTNAELLAENEALRADLALIGERLKEEAINHELCSDYAAVVTDLNTQTSEPWMQHCRGSVTVTAGGEVTLGFSDLDVEVDTLTGDPNTEEIETAVGGYLAEVVGLSPSLHYVIDEITSVEINDSAVQ